MNILHLDSSPRGARSHSRQLTRAFVEELKAAHAGSSIVYRDLGHQPVPHLTEAWIAAAFSDPATYSPAAAGAIAVSNELVDELLAADVIVIGAPMHNFSIPSTLKAYIDQIVRAGRTFNPANYQGLVTGKKLFILTARGASGYGPGEQMEAINFQDPYLKMIFGYIGITDVTFVHDEKTTTGDSNLANSLETVRQIACETAQAAHERVDVTREIALAA